MARKDREFDYDDPLAEPGRWKRWLPRLGMVIALLVALYFLLTSGFFLRRVVVPRLAASVNGTVSVGEISLSPFSRLRLTDLKVCSTSGETVLAARELEARYGLIGLLRDHWVIPEIRLVAPELHVIRFPDGTTSLAALTKSDSRGGPPPRLPEELLVGRVTVSDGTLDYEQRLENGERTRVLLQGAQVDLRNLGNDREATLKLAAQVALARQPAPGSSNQAGRIEFDFQTTARLTLSRSFQPVNAQIGARLVTRQAKGSYARLAGLVGGLEGELDQNSIRKCELRFQRGKTSLGRLTLSGPVDWRRQNMRLRLRLRDLNHEVLDLLGSPFGLAFGHARIAGDALVDLSSNGQVINASTTVDISRLGLRTPRGAAPEVDLKLKLDGRVQLGLKAADIRAFSLTAREGDRVLLRLHAPRAINLLWDPSIRPSINESKVEVELNHLDLARWRPVFGPGMPDGILNIQGVVTNQDDGRRVRAWLTNEVSGLTFRAGDYGVTNAEVRMETLILFKDFLSLSAEEAAVDVALGGSPVLHLEGSASYEFGNDELRAQFEAHADPHDLATHFPTPWIEAQAGAMRMDGTVRFFGPARMIAVSAVLEDFTGRLERYRFQKQRLQLDCSLDWTPEIISLRQVGITSGRGLQSGSAYVGGHYRPGSREGRFDLVLANLNPPAVQPFLAAHLPDFELVDGSLDGNVQLEISPTGRRTCSARVETKHLTFLDRRTGLRHYPLDLRGELALVENNGLVEILTNVVRLPATKKAGNRIEMKGRLNLAETNREPGQITLQAPALDLTSLVDFYRTNTPSASPVAASAETPVPPPPATETASPAAAAVPPLVANLNVGKLVIRRLVCSNLVARLVMTNELARLDPCSVQVGGGWLRLSAVHPLAGTAPGDFQLQAQHLPLEPMSVAFLGSPRGRYLGELNTRLVYRSLGGAPTGEFQVNLTNLTFRLLPRWTRGLLAPVATLLHADELLRSPLRHLGGRATLAGDTLDLKDLSVAGDLFLLNAQGRVKLADPWTNSTLHLPVRLALNERVVRRLGFKNLPAAGQPGFVRLPPFLTVEGTLGAFTNRVDSARLSGLLTGALGRSLGGDAGKTIETIGNLLEGVSGAGNKTNAPATNTPLPFLPGLLDSLRK